MRVLRTSMAVLCVVSVSGWVLIGWDATHTLWRHDPLLSLAAGWAILHVIVDLAEWALSWLRS